MKKKTTMTFLLAGFLIATGVKAQTIQDGMNYLYADRFKSAIGVFEKMIATNPNNMEATYWLGQVYFDMDKNAKAREIYQKALETNGSAPLILVGLGHADLHDNKVAEARARFDAALAASNGKKGPDPLVQSAIGRANVDAKAGDFNFAIQQLEAATLKDPKNTEILLQLGNAYRKAKPGEGGGQAYTTYNKAIEVNPAFAVASIRLAKLFETQKNWELVLQYLNNAVKQDPTYAPAYYELFYYYFFRAKFPEAEEQLQKYIANSDVTAENDYLYAQLCYGKKDFDCAITKATGVITSNAGDVKPKVYKLLSYAYFDKGDYANALTNANLYFSKEKPEGIIAQDYKLKADILSKTGGTPADIYDTYIKGAAADTVLTSKIDFLKKGAEDFKTKGDSLSRIQEGNLRMAIIGLKPNPAQRDYFDAGFAYYQAKDYVRADSIFTFYGTKWPDEVFGPQMLFSIKRALDTSMTLGLAVPPAQKYLEILEKDTAKNKKTIIGVAGYLAQYYANIAKDKEKAIVYFEKMLAMDPGNKDIQGYIDLMKRPAKTTGTAPRGNAKPKPVTKVAVTKPARTGVVKK